MEQERIWTLLSRKLTNEAGTAELAELSFLLTEHPEFNYLAEQITESWEHLPIKDPEFMEATYLLHLQRMKATGFDITANATDNKTESQIPATIIMGKQNKIKRYLKHFAIAASVLLIFFTAYFLFNHYTSLAKQNNIASIGSNKKEIITENGTRTKTLLPDGTVVWLNGGSKVSYTKDFSGKTRDVYLTGEAYFDVAKEHNHPFIVHAGDIDIEALGTAFNVKAYPSDKTVEATLLRGLVEITRENDNKTAAIFLHPDQKLTFVKNEAVQTNIEDKPTAYTISKLDVQSTKDLPETAWMFNRLSFKDDDFETLASKLEHWYNVTIVFEDDAVKKIHFNGSLENETIEQAFTELQMASPFNYKINKDKIYVSSIQ
jgi:transmembrane sensor